VTSGQRRVLVALAGGVAIVAAIVIGFVVAGDGGSAHITTGAPRGSSGTTAASLTTDTTIDLLPVTVATIPIAPPPSSAPPTSGSSTTTSTTTPPPILTGAGAVLAAPPGADSRSLSAGAPCASLADAGWSDVHCGVARSTGAVLTWLTESRPGLAGTPATRAYVFRAGSAGGQSAVLAAADDTGQRFSGVNVRAERVAGDGNVDLVFGFRLLGSGSVLSVDLVQGVGAVAVHSDLNHGAARSAAGQLDTWDATPSPTDASCCPSTFEHDTIRLVQGAWRIVARVSVPAAAVPPSQL
jgi:hypothetical protein